MPAYITAIYQKLSDSKIWAPPAVGAVASGAATGLIAWNPALILPAAVVSVATSALDAGVTYVFDFLYKQNDGEKDALAYNTARTAIVTFIARATIVPLVGSIFGVAMSVSIVATVLFSLLADGLVTVTNGETKARNSNESRMEYSHMFCYLPAPFMASLAARLSQLKGLVV